MKTKFSMILLAGLVLLGQSCKKNSNTQETNTSEASSSDAAEIVAVTPYDVKVTSAVAMRAKPDLSGKKVKCTQWADHDDESVEDGKNGWVCESGCYRDSAYAPKGTTLKVEAKTKGKLRVKKWQNHWYRVTTEDLECPDKKDVWVFGEFVKKG